jgi:hypothetical protein
LLLEEGQLVLDPELGVVGGEERLDPIHRAQRLFAVGVEGRNPAFLTTQAEMVEVAGEHHLAGVLEVDEQDLVAGGVTGRREDPYATVTEDVVVAVEEQLLRLAQVCVEGRVESGKRLAAEGGFVLRGLDQRGRAGHLVGHADMIEVEV